MIYLTAKQIEALPVKKVKAKKYLNNIIGAWDLVEIQRYPIETKYLKGEAGYLSKGKKSVRIIIKQRGKK